MAPWLADGHRQQGEQYPGMPTTMKTRCQGGSHQDRKMPWFEVLTASITAPPMK
jgi:hypothetical protein